MVGFEPDEFGNSERPAAAQEQPALSWVLDRAPSGTDTWTCPDCAARHIRAMEARLDSEWW